MKRVLRAGLFCLGILALGTAAKAGTIVLFPGSPGVDGVQGNTTTSAPGFGDGSFQANSTLSAESKSQIYVDPVALFGHTITVGQIASMSYFTNKAGPATAPDWTLDVYTNPTTNNAASWYHARLNAEPYFTNSTVTPSTWHQWSTSQGSTSLLFYDAFRGNATHDYFGSYTDPTLATINAGPVTWSATGITEDYRNQVVKYLSFQTGSAWASGFSGLLDGFNIQLTNGETGAINFEAVPVPSSVWAGLVLFAGLGAFQLRRKTSIA